MRPVAYRWPKEDTEAISLQGNYAEGEIPINGNLSNIGSGVPEPSVTFYKISRTVSITSSDDMRGVTFTIIGTYMGEVISDDVDGPDIDETVESLEIFDSVTSVTANGNVTNTSIGTGTVGQTHWFAYDTNRSLSSFAVQAVVTGTINYTFAATLQDVQDLDEDEVPVCADLTGGMTSVSISQYKSTGTIPFRYCTIKVNSSGSDDAALEIIMCQGGI